MKTRLKKTQPYLSNEEWSVQSHNIRTLHSLCWAGLRSDYKIITKDQIQEFSKLYSWKLSAKFARVSEEDWLLGVGAITDDDDLWMKVQRARLTMTDPADDALDPGEAQLLKKLDRDYRAYKAERDLIDFTGMVEEAIKRRIVPEDISEIHVDEAQDMCALFYTYHLMLYKALEVPVTWYGDEDQSIYAFMGSDHTLFVNHPAEETVYGELSRRMTKTLAREANDYISNNKQRFPKKIVALKEGIKSAHYTNLDAALDELWEVGTGTVLWLAATNAQIQTIRDELIRREEPVMTSEGEDAARKLIELIKTKPRKLKAEDLKNLVAATVAGKKLIPYQRKFFDKPYDMATKIKQYIEGTESLPFGGLSVTDGGFSPWLAGVLLTGEWERLLDEDQLAIARSLERGATKRYRIELSTFHKSKGREADTVVICKDVRGKALAGVIKDEEMGRRLGFVAMTRALRGNIYYREDGRGTQDYWRVTT